MKIEHGTIDFHGVLLGLGYADVFWKELLGGEGRKSEAQNLKELGF
jgi:hypothetical protein